MTAALLGGWHPAQASKEGSGEAGVGAGAAAPSRGAKFAELKAREQAAKAAAAAAPAAEGQVGGPGHGRPASSGSAPWRGSGGGIQPAA